MPRAAIFRYRTVCVGRARASDELRSAKGEDVEHLADIALADDDLLLAFHNGLDEDSNLSAELLCLGVLVHREAGPLET